MSELLVEEIQNVVETTPALPVAAACAAADRDTRNNIPEDDQAQSPGVGVSQAAVGGYPPKHWRDTVQTNTRETVGGDQSLVRIATPEETAAVTRSSPNVGDIGWQIRGFRDAMEGSQEPPWVIEDLLMEQSATLVSAHPHSLKSLSLLYACLEAVVKKQVWEYFAAPNVTATLFIETEDPPWLVEARIRGFAKGLGLGNEDTVPGFHYACVGPFDLVKEEDRIHGLVKEHSLSLIVISTLQSLLEGKNWISQEDMQSIMAMIVRLSRRCPTVVLTHSPWDKRQRRAAGTVTQAANFLTTMHLQKTVIPKSGETFAHIVLDSKAGAFETNFSLKLVTENGGRDPGSVRRVVFAGKGWATGLKRDAIEAALEDDPDASAKDIAEQVGVSQRYVEKIKKKLAGE
jgi:hypothetical protein